MDFEFCKWERHVIIQVKDNYFIPSFPTLYSPHCITSIPPRPSVQNAAMTDERNHIHQYRMPMTDERNYFHQYRKPMTDERNHIHQYRIRMTDERNHFHQYRMPMTDERNHFKRTLDNKFYKPSVCPCIDMQITFNS